MSCLCSEDVDAGPNCAAKATFGNCWLHMGRTSSETFKALTAKASAAAIRWQAMLRPSIEPLVGEVRQQMATPAPPARADAFRMRTPACCHLRHVWADQCHVKAF